MPPKSKGRTLTEAIQKTEIIRLSNRGPIDFGQAIQKLEATNFRRPAAVLEALLKKHGRRDGDG